MSRSSLATMRPAPHEAPVAEARPVEVASVPDTETLADARTFLRLENVSVKFPIYNASSRSLRSSLLQRTAGGRLNIDHGQVVVDALKNVSFTVREGERLALVGPNGAGKTTLLRTIAGIYEPAAGTVETNGSISSLFDLTLGIDAEATGYENIFLRGLLSGLSTREIRERRDEIAAFSGLGDYLSMPVRTYSAGMVLRLAFAISTSFQPDILLMDEWLSVGDAKFIATAEERLKQLVDRAATVVFASHVSEQVRQICTHAALIVEGEVLEVGPVDSVLAIYERISERAA